MSLSHIMVNYAKKSVIFGYLHTSHTSLQLTFTFAKFSNPTLSYSLRDMVVWDDDDDDQ